MFGPQLTTWDDAEEDRFEYIEEYDHPSLFGGRPTANITTLDSSSVEREIPRRRGQLQQVSMAPGCWDRLRLTIFTAKPGAGGGKKK